MRIDADAAGAEALYRQAADRGNTVGLHFLAWMRNKAGDTIGAETLCRQGADSESTELLEERYGV